MFPIVINKFSENTPILFSSGRSVIRCFGRVKEVLTDNMVGSLFKSVGIDIEVRVAHHYFLMMFRKRLLVVPIRKIEKAVPNLMLTRKLMDTTPFTLNSR